MRDLFRITVGMVSPGVGRAKALAEKPGVPRLWSCASSGQPGPLSPRELWPFNL